MSYMAETHNMFLPSTLRNNMGVVSPIRNMRTTTWHSKRTSVSSNIDVNRPMQRKGFKNANKIRGRNFNDRIALTMPSIEAADKYVDNLKNKTIDVTPTMKLKSHQLKDHTVFNQVSANQQQMTTRLKKVLKGIPNRAESSIESNNSANATARLNSQAHSDNASIGFGPWKRNKHSRLGSMALQKDEVLSPVFNPRGST